MRRAGLHMALGAAVLAGCSGPPDYVPPGGRDALRVSDERNPLGYSDGTRAKRIANDICGPKGVKSSIDDRYEGGYWIFVEGCA